MTCHCSDLSSTSEIIITPPMYEADLQAVWYFSECNLYYLSVWTTLTEFIREQSGSRSVKLHSMWPSARWQTICHFTSEAFEVVWLYFHAALAQQALLSQISIHLWLFQQCYNPCQIIFFINHKHLCRLCICTSRISYFSLFPMPKKETIRPIVPLLFLREIPPTSFHPL